MCFAEHKITMEHLIELTDDNIKELLPLIGDRTQLKLAIKQRANGIADNSRPTKMTQLHRNKITVRCIHILV